MHALQQQCMAGVTRKNQRSFNAEGPVLPDLSPSRSLYPTGVKVLIGLQFCWFPLWHVWFIIILFRILSMMAYTFIV